MQALKTADWLALLVNRACIDSTQHVCSPSDGFDWRTRLNTQSNWRVEWTKRIQRMYFLCEKLLFSFTMVSITMQAVQIDISNLIQNGFSSSRIVIAILLFFLLFETQTTLLHDTNFTNRKQKSNQLKTRILVHFSNTIVVVYSLVFFHLWSFNSMFVCLFVHYEMVFVISATSIILLHLQVISVTVNFHSFVLGFVNCLSFWFQFFAIELN